MNDLKNQKTVVPQKGKGAKVEDGKLHAALPPLSYHMLRVKA